MLRTFRLLSAVVALALALGGVAAAPAFAQAKPIEIKFWHAMGGDTRLNAIKKLVDDFNTANPTIHVTAEYKGSYPDLFNNTLLVSRQKSAPHIVQLYEIGSQLAADSGVFTPIADVIDDAGKKQLDDVIPAVAGYYSLNGKYNSVPWNSSNPVLYYNKDIMKAAGLDPEKPPVTWAEIKTACAAIVKANATANCFTVSLNGWFIEQWLALQGQTLVDNDNGRSGRPTKTNLDSQAAVDTFQFLKDLNDAKYFTYSGKLEDWDGSTAIFQSKQAAFLIDSTSDVATNQQAADDGKFTMGIGKMPSNDKVDRVGNIIGGASLWLVGGKSKEETAAAAKFVLYLNSAPAMVAWHKASGYLPITGASQKLLNDEKWFDTHPAYKVALDQLNASKATPATAGALIGPFQKVRTIVEESLQAMFNGKMDAKAAAADAKKRADAEIATYNANFQ